MLKLWTVASPCPVQWNQPEGIGRDFQSMPSYLTGLSPISVFRSLGNARKCRT